MKQFWKKHKFKVGVFISILFIVGLWIWPPAGHPSYSLYYAYTPQDVEWGVHRKRAPFESKGEVECRRVLEELYGLPFPKVRPDFLKNEVAGTGQSMELDGYNKELGIAFEYHGKQHYEYVPYFHTTKDSFYNQKYRDDIKRRLCSENGVRLIEVPYSVENIEEYIKKELNK